MVCLDLGIYVEFWHLLTIQHIITKVLCDISFGFTPANATLRLLLLQC